MALMTLWGKSVLGISLLCGGCNLLFGKKEKDPGETDVSQLPYRAGSNPRWVYEGPLPALEKPRVTLSTTGLTVRVQGLLPKTFQGALPYYAITWGEPGGPTQVHVVYPISVGNIP